MKDEKQKIKVIMNLEGSYELISEELKNLLYEFRALAEAKGFVVSDED